MQSGSREEREWEKKRKKKMHRTTHKNTKTQRRRVQRRDADKTKIRNQKEKKLRELRNYFDVNPPTEHTIHHARNLSLSAELTIYPVSKNHWHLCLLLTQNTKHKKHKKHGKRKWILTIIVVVVLSITFPGK